MAWPPSFHSTISRLAILRERVPDAHMLCNSTLRSMGILSVQRAETLSLEEYEQFGIGYVAKLCMKHYEKAKS